jgi:hypothetical protein
MYWGAAKKYTRDHCQYTLRSLKENLPFAFNSISIETMRAYARLSWRWMDAYRHGLTGKMAEYAVKNNKSHRRINENVTN